MIDEWVIPMDYTITSLADLDDKIVENNRDIVDAVNAIIADGAIQVTYIPGNHDMTFSEEEAERIFPGINQVRDAEGLGTYTALNGEAAIEHGHRYNFICGPDPISNRDLTGSGSSILPCGYFLTRIAVTSALEGAAGTPSAIPMISQDQADATQTAYYAYNMGLAAILSQLPLSESLSDAVIKTNFDGYTDTYAIGDLLPYQDENGEVKINLYDGASSKIGRKDRRKIRWRCRLT
jgi:UDP-2,3-diacylglucosamine pyrophosphatase LpxH